MYKKLQTRNQQRDIYHYTIINNIYVYRSMSCMAPTTLTKNVRIVADRLGIVAVVFKTEKFHCCHVKS